MSKTMKYIELAFKYVEYGFISIAFLFLLGLGSFFAYCAPFAAFQGQYFISSVLFFYSLPWFAMCYLILRITIRYPHNISQEVRVRAAASDTEGTVQAEDDWMDRYNEWVGGTRA